MFVTLNYGSRNGHSIDMPFVHAQALIDAGRATRSDGPQEITVKPVAVPERIPVPPGWKTLPYFSKVKLAKEITGRRDISGSDDINEAIEKYVAGGTPAL